jgi:hypothetical protein
VPKFIFSYRHPADYTPGGLGNDGRAAWTTYFERIGPSVIDRGQPAFERTSIGTVGQTTNLGGYSIVQADDLEAALALARGYPLVDRGGGVEIGLLAELPPNHPDALLKDRPGIT